MNAPYFLAIDIGTTRTSAATARSAPDGSLLATAFPLGRAGDNAPTVAFAADGDVLFGDAAERRGGPHPERLIREFKRRIGDDVPILAADRAFSPEELYARMVDWAARAVVEREGDTPARVAVTIPAAWGEYRADVVRAALAEHGWRDVEILTEPEAAARHYCASHPIAEGEALAIYDFGGGTFDAVVLRADGDGVVRAAGAPSGLADLGGADFDDAMLRHVLRTARVDAVALAGEPSGRVALAALRRECVEAKESLSFDSEAIIPVLAAGQQAAVRISRDEFEAMIADDLERTLDAFETALADAGVSPTDLRAILLTGGSSRIPRVAQLLSERFDRPIAVDADPKAIIALGAARAAADAAALPLTSETAPAGSEEAPVALALVDAPRTAVAPRRWFRRAPRTAWAAVGFTVLATGAALAMAPTLGMGMVSATERAAMTAAPVADGVSDAAGSPSRTASSPAAAAPSAGAPEGTDAAPPKATAPRGPGKAPGVSPRPGAAPGAEATRSGSGTPASPAGTSGSTPVSGPSGSSVPASTPHDPGPTGPGASTPSPAPVDPAPADPDPVDPGPVDPGPVVTEPEPTPPSDPGPSDTGTTDPDPTPPEDPPPPPSESPAV